MAEPKHSANPTPAILGIPFDANSSFLRGAAEAPPLIRRALFSDSSNMWTESGIDLGAPGVLLDEGDLDLSDAGAAFGRIETAVDDALARGLAPISLGGDHSITYPILNGFRKHFPRLSVLHFDAHPDLYDEFEGNRFSHASPFARIMESGLADRLVQIGIRTMSGHQRTQAERFGVEVIEMRALRDVPVLEFASPLYVTFDMDALDPAFAPGVSHHEPGGLSTRQAVDILQAVRARVVGGDVVEFNPRRDPLGITAMAAAKILKEIAARMLEACPAV